jgi:hypothetical protein
MMRDFEKQRLIGPVAHKLQAYGQTLLGQATRHGDGGNASQVRGAIQSQEQGAGGVRGAMDDG